MAIQIFDRPSGGEIFGSALGTGLSQGLQNLAALKLNQLSQRQQVAEASQFWKGLGFPEQIAQQFAAAPAPVQKSLLDRLEGLSIPGTAPVSPVQNLNQEMAPTMAPAQSLQEAQQTHPEQVVSQQAQPPKKGVIIGANPVERRHREQLQFQKEKEAARQKMSQFKETKAERKDIIEKAKAARQNLQDLDRLEELEKEGKLDTPGYVEFLKRSGLDVPALMNPGSEEFNKIAANFVRDAKAIFGSRVSNYEVEQFLKTIPSLSQSPEGRKRVIANLKNIARGSLEYNTALKEVMQENKGIPPYDLLEKVDEKVEKKLEKLSKRFKEDLAKPVPEGQNKLITALQAAGGSVLGLPGTIAGGLGKAAGSLISALV